MSKYLINLKFLSHQAEFFELQRGPNAIPNPALIGGFGCGKTRTIAACALDKLISYPGVLGAIYEPTYGAIREIIVPALDNICLEYGIKSHWNRQENMYRTAVGNILLKSMHEPEKIVGYQVGWSYVDEIDTMKKHKAKAAWDKIIARARIPLHDGSPNVVGAATTPEGFAFCYERWVEENRKGYKFVRGRTQTALDAGFVSKTYVENLTASYTKELLQAYLEGEFVNMNAASFYYGFSDENIGDVAMDPYLPINICFDFNVNPAVACIVQDKSEFDIRVPITIYRNNSNTREVCLEIKERLKAFKHQDVVIYGDASGNSRDTRSTLSDYAIIEEELSTYFNSFTFRVPRSNSSVRDRENAVNNQLQKNNVIIDPINKELIRDFRQIVRKNNEMDKGDINLTHISDAFGYFIATKYPIKRTVKVETRAL